MKIVSIELVEVMVPALAGRVNSPTTDKPLHKMVSGAASAWSLQFDELSKFMLVAKCDDGTLGYGESLRGADPAVLTAMAEALVGVAIEDLAWQSLPFAKTREYDALEVLVLDLLGKHAGLPVSALLGGTLRPAVAVGAWSGHRTPDDAGVVAARALAEGFDCLKLKCDLEDDIAAIAASILEATNPKFRVILDPNERFDEYRHAREIARKLEHLGNVLCLEDPLPRWDLASYRRLRETTDVPIAVHVALGYPSLGQRVEDVANTYKADAADIFNLSGCVSDFLRMGRFADIVHIPYWHGSEIDLGILEAAYVHVAAASAGCVLPSDILGRSVREHDLLVEPLAIHDGAVDVPGGVGLGVTIDLDALERYEMRRIEVRA